MALRLPPRAVSVSERFDQHLNATFVAERPPSYGAVRVVPERVFVDSGPWIGLASTRDGRHADADRLFRAALARRLPLATTDLVVAETHRLLLFRAGGAAARAFLDRIDRSPSLRLPVGRDRLAERAPAAARPSPSVSSSVFDHR